MSEPLAVTLEEGHIAGDLACVCGYNLRTLAYTGKCPECGGLVEHAERMHRRDQAELRHVLSTRRLLTRVYLMVWAYCVTVFVLARFNPGGPEVLFFGVFAVGIIGLGVTAFVAVYHLLLVVITFNQGHPKQAWRLAWRLPLCPAIPVVIVLIVAAFL